MGQTYQSTVINAPVEKVWQAVRDFHDMSWAPKVITRVEAVGDKKGNEAGARRVLNDAFHETLRVDMRYSRAVTLGIIMSTAIPLRAALCHPRSGLVQTILLVVFATCMFSAGCGSGDAPAIPPTGPSTPPTGPSTSQEPGDQEWIQLGGQFAAFGIDALQRALSEGTAQRFASRPLDFSVRTPLSFQTSYFCCGLSAQQYITVSGRVDVNVDASGLVTVTETFGQATLGWSGPSGTHTIELDTDALRITSQMVTVNGVAQRGQQFRLSGPITYVLAAGERKPATIDVVLGYGDFHLTSPQPLATGRIGPVQVSNTTLPTPPVSRRCPCPGGPQPGAPPNPGCSLMCP